MPIAALFFPIPQIAVQIAVIFAKISRFDYPKEWPNLFSDLLSLVSNGTTLTIRRVYFTLHHILKELSSKRLLADQKNFAQITSALFDHIWGQWCSDTQAILTALPEGLERPLQVGASVVVKAVYDDAQYIDDVMS